MPDPAQPDPHPAPGRPPRARARAATLAWLDSRPQAARALAGRIDGALLRKDWEATKAFFARHYVAIVILGALAVSLGALLIGLWRVPFLVNALLDDLQANAADPDATRGTVVALAAVLAAITIIGTLITQAIRVWTSERQTRTIEQGHVTDRLTKAIEQLGAEKTVKRIEKNAEGAESRDAEGRLRVVETTVPNLEVRLGAIYALERIAQDSERDHITIMEILCAYIRENAKAAEASPNPLDDWPEKTSENSAQRQKLLNRRSQELDTWIEDTHPPRVDVQAAATVIGRRMDSRRRTETLARFDLDLKDINLRRAALKGVHLENANLRDARLEGANLRGAHLEGADLGNVRLECANLRGATLGGVDLCGAHLERSNLRRAQLNYANLGKARLEMANLGGAQLEMADLCNARLEGANLSGAQLVGANLNNARLEGANFRRAQLERTKFCGAWLEATNLIGADFRGADWTDATNGASTTHFADLRGIRGLTQAQLEYFIGNEATLLPRDLNENGEPYYVWSCWDTPPADFDAMLVSAAGPLASAEGRENLRHQLLCGPGNPRRRTGTPLALDAPYPEGHPLAERRS